MYFTSPTSSINLPPVPFPSPAYTSTAMSRADSRDSTTSTFSTSSYDTYLHSTSPPSCAWDISLRPRSSSSTLSEHRDSQVIQGNGWIPSPFRSCQMMRSNSFTSEPTSYISDDDLLCITSPSSSHAGEETPTSEEAQTHLGPERRELSTEEQIAILDAARAKEDASLARLQAAALAREKKARMVRFAETSHPPPAQQGQERRSSSGQPRRPAVQLKRRSTAVRRNLALLS